MATNSVDPGRTAIERPEMRMNDSNWRTYQRYKGRALLKSGDGIVAPGGIVIDGRPWRGFKHSAQVQTYVMNRPEDLLLEPDPHVKYCWRPREDPKHSTEALVKTGCLRPVEYSEVDKESELRMWVYEYSGVGAPSDDDKEPIVGLVACGNMALFEVAPRWAYEWYDQAVDLAFSHLGGLQPGFEDAAEAFAARNRGMRHHGSEIKVSDMQTVEAETRNPIGPGAPFGDVTKGGP